MDKKVTGQIIGKDETREALVSARDRFKLYLDHLRLKKGELREMKIDNNKKREQMTQEQRIAENSKFGTMTKKADFIRAAKFASNFEDMTSVHAIGAAYIDHRDKAKLCAPDKCHEKKGP